MSPEIEAGMARDLECALLRKALLSAVAAINASLEACIALSNSDRTVAHEQLERAVERGTENLDEALAYIKEALDVRHGA